MYIDFFCECFKEAEKKEAVIWNDQKYTYQTLNENIQQHLEELPEILQEAKIIALEADFSPRSVALLLALIECGCIIVPLTKSVAHKKERFLEIAQVEAVLEIDTNDRVQCRDTKIKATHPILTGLKKKKHPGLILFSSGSTGESKAAVHDVVPLLEKFKTRRHAMRAISFLLFDHIGGFNTLLYNLSNGGCIITTNERKPENICALIEKYQVETLPTSPTFLNLLLISEAYKHHDLSSLKLITYGTEVMPESTLKKIHAILPKVKLLQTYGLSELGILRSKSRASDSLWVKIGGEGYETRIVNGILEIKARSAMLGYLNAESPFTEDGWFHTGDEVEVDGEYIKILGRKSEIINVGGEKVYPAEVESVLQEIEEVEDVVVSGEKNPITGQIVKARIKLKSEEGLAEFRKRVRNYCKGKLENYKTPQKIELVEKTMYSERFKKIRRG